MDREKSSKYELTFRKALGGFGEMDAPGRTAAYQKLRRATEVLLAKPGTGLGPEEATEVRALLEDAIAVHEGRYRPIPARAATSGSAALAKPVQATRGTNDVGGASRPPGARWKPLAAGAAVGLLIAAGVVGLLVGTGVLSAGHASQLAEALASSRPQFARATAFLGKVRGEVERLQREEPDRLSAAQKFMSIRMVLPDLAKEMPKHLPRHSDILIRANKSGYKIIANWTLCATAQQVQPSMVDPVRQSGTFGCGFYGYWNEAGAKW